MLLRLIRQLAIAMLCIASFSPAAFGDPGKEPEAPAPIVPASELSLLDRHNAAAERAAREGDWKEALKYVDFSGHEQEALARAMLAYGAAQEKLRSAVLGQFDAKTWKAAAKSLGVPEHPRPQKAKRTTRMKDGILYVKQAGAATEVPYVKVDGLWKLSIRDVVFLALKGKVKDREIEEATVYAVAGTIASLLEQRQEKLEALANDVKVGRFESPEAFRTAAADLLKTKPRKKSGP